MITISHPGTGGTAEVTQEAFDGCWADLGWQLVVDADPVEAEPLVPLEQLPDEGSIPAAELAGEQPPPGNASRDRMLRFLAAAGIPHDPTAKRDELRSLLTVQPA